MSTSLPRRALGSTGIQVSVLGLGTVKFGRNTHLRHPHPFSIPDDATATRLLDLARDLGMNLLDTAPAYGASEARLGRILKGRREDFVLVSKCGEIHDRQGSRHDFTPEHTRASVLASLQRLATDHLDCVLLHSDGDDLALLRSSGALDALAELKREGHIRSYGISSKTPSGGLEALSRVDVVMLTLSPGVQADRPVALAAAAQGRGVLVKKALDSGHLSGDPGTALRWAASQPGVSAVLVGSIDADHIRSNAEALMELPA